MQPNKNIPTDLEHLAELGYDSFPNAEKDVEQLKQTIKTRYGSNAGLSGSFIALVIGLFIGITVFFTIYNTPLLFPSRYENIADKNSLMNEVKNVTLDTIQVISQSKTPHLISEKFIEPIEVDSITNVDHLDGARISVLTKDPILKTDLKYAPNAPIIYLHDLKIANYHAYYFEAQKMIIVGQHVDPDKANRTDQGSLTKMPPNYYLHEAIDDAMKLFKKQKYQECLSLLNTVSEKSKDDVNCDFYKGMCYYYLKNYEASYTSLNLAGANKINVFLEESEFYMALSAIKAGRSEEGQKKLLEIASNKGFYASKAQEIMPK